MTDTVNEKTTSYVDVTFKDKDGNPATPLTVDYQIDCKTTGTAIKAATSLTPASSVTITVSATENRIINKRNTKERRIITVTATYAGSQESRHEFEFDVVNLKHVS